MNVGIPPRSLNHRLPAACEAPTANAASSLLDPLAISRQNDRSTSRRNDGFPGDFIGALPVNSVIHPSGLPIATLLNQVLRPPVESALVCSVHMPIGELHSHRRSGIRPELKRRSFLLVHFNDNYSPDIGRKTIPRHDERLVAWVEDTIRTILERQAVRLIRDKDDTTRVGADYQHVKEELAEAIKKLGDRATHSKITTHDLVVPYPATHEDEVIMNFAGLIADGSLPGFYLLGVPGNSTRYDGLFNFSTPNADEKVGTDVPPWNRRTTLQQGR